MDPGSSKHASSARFLDTKDAATKAQEYEWVSKTNWLASYIRPEADRLIEEFKKKHNKPDLKQESAYAMKHMRKKFLHKNNQTPDHFLEDMIKAKTAHLSDKFNTAQIDKYMQEEMGRMIDAMQDFMDKVKERNEVNQQSMKKGN